MIILEDKTTRLDRISRQVQSLLNGEDSQFNEVVTKIKHFDYSSDGEGSVSGQELLDVLTSPNLLYTVKIRTYRPRWRWSRALGYYSGGDTIYLNSRKLNRSNRSIAGTIAHEIIHLVDGAVSNMNFGHGDNSPAGKQNSAPYFIGGLVSSWVE